MESYAHNIARNLFFSILMRHGTYSEDGKAFSDSSMILAREVKVSASWLETGAIDFDGLWHVEKGVFYRDPYEKTPVPKALYSIDIASINKGCIYEAFEITYKHSSDQRKMLDLAKNCTHLYEVFAWNILNKNPRSNEIKGFEWKVTDGKMQSASVIFFMGNNGRGN